MLNIRHLTKSYRSGGEPVKVLRGVDLTVAAGERVALTGESGSGKSTLLHLIAGLDAADGGDILLEGASIGTLDDAARAAIRRERLGLVFQQFNLVPSLSVADNLNFQARLAGRHDPAWHTELVERLGLKPLLKRYPEQLSGGQQQRVAVARALVTRPDVIVADEPTGALDSEASDDLLDFLRHCVDDLGQSVVMVTHDRDAAARADDIVTVADGQVSTTRGQEVLA